MELKVSQDGSLRLDAQALAALGLPLSPGSTVLVDPAASAPTQAHAPLGLTMRDTNPVLRRVYVEPTSRCNLNCTTCIRNTWSEDFADMPWELYESLLEGLREMPHLERMSFWGYGEPLLHPRIVDMIAGAKELGVKTQIITNGMLLDEAMIDALIAAGLDSLIVSLDGPDAQSYEGVRFGADFDRVVSNLRTVLRKRRRLVRGRAGLPSLEVGIEFVVLRDSLTQLGKMHALAAELGVDFTFISNVLPFRAQDAQQTLYPASVNAQRRTPRMYLPPLDNIDGLAHHVADMVAPDEPIHYLQTPRDSHGGRCPFVDEGSLVVGSSGQTSACMALLHSAPCQVMGRQKQVDAKSFGSLEEATLSQIWNSEDFTSFRERVQRFDFAPCVHCTGCRKSNSNGRDCHGSPFPTCGDCLWAQGVIQCP